MELTHLCSIKRQHSHTYLRRLSPDAPWRGRIVRKFRSWTLASSKHPKCVEYFKSATGLRNERKRHARSPHLYIIHPFSTFRLYYEMYMVVVYLQAFLIRILDLEYSNEISVMDILYEIICLLCTGDIIMTFFTGYATPSQEIVLEPKKIAKRYICSMFFITDVFAFTPVKLITWLYEEQRRLYADVIVDALRMLIILRLYTVNLYIMNSADYFGVATKKISVIVRYTTSVFILVTYFGAVNFNIPRLRLLVRQNLPKGSWISQSKILRKDTSSKILRSFFRSSALLLGTSQGLVDVNKWEELILTIFTFIFGRFYTILLTVLILHMMAQSRMLDTKYSRIMNQLEEYMTYKNLPDPMRKRLKMYYDYKYQKKFFREEVVTTTLSDGLKREIKMHNCRKLVTNVTLFAGLSTQTVNDILEYLRLEVYLPNDPIIKVGDPGDCMYFLSSGTVAVYTASGKELCHLQDGAYFGEIALVLKNHLRSANVIAVEICEVYSLARSHFKKYFMSNQRLFQKLYQKAEDRYEMLLMVEEMYKKK